jgi:ATP/maltotriose-dependent transcriptional regulator MalT
MTTIDALLLGREAFERRAWADAFAGLSALDRDSSLEPVDLERLATAAYLLGLDDESAVVWERAHRARLRQDDVEGAARTAFWLAFGLLNRGQSARGGGWIARARRLLEDRKHECPETGYLLLPQAVQRIAEGDFATAIDLTGQAGEIGRSFFDPDLVAFARTIEGRALIGDRRTAEGMTLLDEVMVGVLADEIGPMVAGAVYCSVIEACQETFDLRRAKEWTAALTRWCQSQPDLVPYRGQCLVHRAEVLQLQGAWSDAADAAQQACDGFLHRPQPAAGAAFYQRAELHRVRGEFAEAEDCYRQASQWGREPQPGLALMRLALGQVDVAAKAISRALDEARGSARTSRLLPAHIEIMLAAGDVAAARASAEELSTIADDLETSILDALATCARGAVLLGEGDARAALVELRSSWRAWQDLEAPYEAARARVLIGVACRELGDDEAAEMELDAARSVFQQLGAKADVVRAETPSRRRAPRPTGPLTAREVEVLRLAATGKTNRLIASDLFLSERTVARHMSNIFGKLGVSTRAAATAYAYEHDLWRRA